MTDTTTATIRVDVNAAKKVQDDIPQATRGGILEDKNKTKMILTLKTIEGA